MIGSSMVCSEDKVSKEILTLEQQIEYKANELHSIKSDLKVHTEKKSQLLERERILQQEIEESRAKLRSLESELKNLDQKKNVLKNYKPDEQYPNLLKATP